MSQTAQNVELDKAFEALKTYTTSGDVAILAPIDTAVSGVQTEPASRAALEKRLAGALVASYSAEARAFACRQLALIGTPASVPAVAPLLVEDELSVFARNVLERIPGPESERALRDGLGKTKGITRVGVINSVAARRDAASVPILIKILAEDPESAVAAAKALGEIGTLDAAKALVGARGKGPAPVQLAVADGMLISVDRLLAAGQRGQAISMLELLTESSQPAHIRMAATRTLSSTLRP